MTIDEGCAIVGAIVITATGAQKIVGIPPIRQWKRRPAAPSSPQREPEEISPYGRAGNPNQLEWARSEGNPLFASFNYVPTEILGLYVVLTAILPRVYPVSKVAILALTLLLVPGTMFFLMAQALKRKGVKRASTAFFSALWPVTLAAMIAFIPWALLIHPDTLGGVVPLSSTSMAIFSLNGILLVSVGLVALRMRGSV